MFPCELIPCMDRLGIDKFEFSILSKVTLSCGQMYGGSKCEDEH